MQPEHIFKTLFLYHLAEALDGRATRIHVRCHEDGSFSISDNGRGMAFEKVILSQPYIDLCLGQVARLDERRTDPIESGSVLLHALGLSVAAQACSKLELTIARNGEEHYGIWTPDPPSVAWSSPVPTSETGTTIKVLPREGGLDPAWVARQVAQISLRCPTIDFSW